ncbi:hypothetical protein AB0C33_46725 [Nonomuraea sp. NPDC048881]|uniref:hypothetical protein n=1 Tax=Nonomuraea sp. NPDC048881 TaxID=3155030 RepID=UPI0033BFCB6D
MDDDQVMSVFVWVLLTLATVNALAGAYTVIVGHPPTWMARRNKPRSGHLSGWSALLMSLFIALLVINLSGGLPSYALLLVTVGQIICSFGAAALSMIDHSRGRA